MAKAKQSRRSRKRDLVVTSVTTVRGRILYSLCRLLFSDEENFVYQLVKLAHTKKGKTLKVEDWVFEHLQQLDELNLLTLERGPEPRLSEDTVSCLRQIPFTEGQLVAPKDLLLLE